MTDLLGRSVAIISMHTTKLESFGEIRKRGKRNLENKFLEMVFQILQEIITYKLNWSVEFLDKLYGTCFAAWPRINWWQLILCANCFVSKY